MAPMLQALGKIAGKASRSWEAGARECMCLTCGSRAVNSLVETVYNLDNKGLNVS